MVQKVYPDATSAVEALLFGGMIIDTGGFARERSQRGGPRLLDGAKIPCFEDIAHVAKFSGGQSNPTYLATHRPR
jgi:hypothetical protein